MKKVTRFRLRKDDLINKRARIISLIIKKTRTISFHYNSLIKSFNMENIFYSKQTIASKCIFVESNIFSMLKDLINELE